MKGQEMSVQYWMFISAMFHDIPNNIVRLNYNLLCFLYYFVICAESEIQYRNIFEFKRQIYNTEYSKDSESSITTWKMWNTAAVRSVKLVVMVIRERG
jgi:hypothetical protein